jgi:hypothetical protein
MRDQRPFRTWFWYNRVRLPFINWRLRRMWNATPPDQRPEVCPRVGRISAEAYAWALYKVPEIEAAGRDGGHIGTRPFSEFRKAVKTK